VGVAREAAREFLRLRIEAHAYQGAGPVPALTECLHETHGMSLVACRLARGRCAPAAACRPRAGPHGPGPGSVSRLLERLEPQALWTRVVAKAALLVFLVLAVVALEELHVAVALEGEDVGRDAVEEPAVMADHE